ncbi:Lipoyltransferase and lipoate-protein ligase [Calocera viscosa TUFC12733]|uniref:Putative lipoate-protein ligase A n=1 Tax=Calocera viscosa (strain TUFC12733) TaxID=1330018 RepID=A0A167NUH4_CALVF|nr:Lipoyltransferase and lipoate-protein ligase [Calocera viscosa TUFC12733]
MRPTPLLLRLKSSPPPPPPKPLGRARIVLSTSLSPWHNLAYEDWLFRNTPADEPLLFLYRNRACVVIGRNQNPWLETAPSHLASLHIPLVRRRSGGGAVFHDPGNTNYSMMLPREHFARRPQAELVASALKAMGATRARVNERNDIYVGKYKMSPCLSFWPLLGDDHISGSAYKIISARAYHHGTMLLSTDTSALSAALRSPFENIMMTSRSVESVRAPVKSLQELGAAASEEGAELEGFTHEQFVEAMKERWVEKHGPAEELTVEEGEMEGIERVKKGVEELRTWEWTFGQTPLFELRGTLPLEGTKQTVMYKVYHGQITDIVFHDTAQPTAEERQLAGMLVDERAPFVEFMGQGGGEHVEEKVDDAEIA